MAKKLPRNTNKELLALAGAGPALMPKDFDPDYASTPVSIDPAKERAWFKSRGLPLPEGYDPLDMEGYVEDEEFNPVRIISPKNAKYSD